jgi:hypothetical protein
MLPSVGRSILRSRFGRGGLALAAAAFMLAALFGSSGLTPRAYAQACCWPWQTSFTGYGGYGGWGGGLGGYGWPGYNSWGYNSYSPYSSYGYGGYGSSPYSSYGYGGYGSSPYSSYGYGGYGSSPYSSYGYSSYTSPIYASPGVGTSYTSPSASAYAINPPGVAVTSPPQQYPFPTTIIGGYLGYEAYTISGQYCKDKSGGMVWVNAGTAVPDGLTCPGVTTSSSSTYAPAAGGTQYSVAPISLNGYLAP